MSEAEERDALLRRSEGLAKAEDWGDDAEDVNRRLLEADPRCAVALTRLGRILFERGDLDEGEQMYQRVLDLDPSNAIAKGGLRRIEKSRRPPELGALDDKGLRGYFPSVDDIGASRWAALERLKAEGRQKRWSEGDRDVAQRYHGFFSAEGFGAFSPQDFLEFYRTSALASIGNASLVADSYVKEMGIEEYGRRAKEAIEYLLFETEPSLEQRLTNLIDGNTPPAVPGVKEAILTKVLVAAWPDRFFPALVYDSPGGSGKRQVGEGVFDLRLPPRDRVAWTIGRLAVWSNDLFLEIGRRLGFPNAPSAGDFIWSIWNEQRAGRDPLREG